MFCPGFNPTEFLFWVQIDFFPSIHFSTELTYSQFRRAVKLATNTSESVDRSCYCCKPLRIAANLHITNEGIPIRILSVSLALSEAWWGGTDGLETRSDPPSAHFLQRHIIHIHKPFALETCGVGCVTTVSSVKPRRSESAIKNTGDIFTEHKTGAWWCSGIRTRFGHDWTFCLSGFIVGQIWVNCPWCWRVKVNHCSKITIDLFRMDLPTAVKDKVHLRTFYFDYNLCWILSTQLFAKFQSPHSTLLYFNIFLGLKKVKWSTSLNLIYYRFSLVC